MAKLTPKTPSHYPWEPPTQQLIPRLLVITAGPFLPLLHLLKKVGKVFDNFFGATGHTLWAKMRKKGNS